MYSRTWIRDEGRVIEICPKNVRGLDTFYPPLATYNSFDSFLPPAAIFTPQGMAGCTKCTKCKSAYYPLLHDCTFKNYAKTALCFSCMYNFGNSFCLIHPFMIFGGCLNSNLRVMPQSTLWATQHPTEPIGTLLSYADPPELRCTLLSYPAPSELGCTVPYRATLHPTELQRTHLSYKAPSGQRCSF